MSPYEDPETAREFALLDLEEECAAPQHLPSDGHGGKPQQPGVTRQSMRKTPSKDTSQSGAFGTATGDKVPLSPPASGGSPEKSTLKPASFAATNAASPKSTESPSTLGERGHG